MSDFKKLDVWNKAHLLALDAHKTAIGIRGAHYVSLRSQLIRAAMSIPANIVEGREQASEKDFARFLRYSIGSASELEYHLIIGRNMGLISQESFDSLLEKIEQVRKMLHGLVRRLESG
ncbi:MAG: four helix bundle protein [Gemmatimonadaceae bacterium]